MGDGGGVRVARVFEGGDSGGVAGGEVELAAVREACAEIRCG